MDYPLDLNTLNRENLGQSERIAELERQVAALKRAGDALVAWVGVSEMCYDGEQASDDIAAWEAAKAMEGK